MKKILISTFAIVAVTSLTFSGCGDTTESAPTTSNNSLSSLGFTNQSSSFSFNSSSPTSSVRKILVSDAYVLNALVKIGNTTANITADSGQYEWTSNPSGEITVLRGVNDLNNNNSVDVNDAYAPNMSAPKGYSNVNPFTTLVNNGATNAEMFKNYPNAFEVDPSFNYDVVSAGKQNIEIAKETLKAAIILATGQKQSKQRAFLPDPFSDGSANNSSSLSSSSSSSEETNSSSSINSNSSDSSTMSSASSLSSASNSSTGTTPPSEIIPAAVIQAIDTSTSTQELNAIAKEQLDAIFGAIVL